MDNAGRMVFVMMVVLFGLAIIAQYMIDLQEGSKTKICEELRFYDGHEDVMEGFSKVGFQCYNYVYHEDKPRTKEYSKPIYHDQLEGNIVYEWKEEYDPNTVEQEILVDNGEISIGNYDEKDKVCREDVLIAEKKLYCEVQNK